MVVVEKKHYHLHHFLCDSCGVKLKGKDSWGSYYQAGDQRLCQNCFEKKNFVCDKCGKKIIDEYVSLMGMNLHKSCTTCIYCRKPVNEHGTKAGNHMAHLDCYMENNFTRCGLCEDFILQPNAVKVGDWVGFV